MTTAQVWKNVITSLITRTYMAAILLTTVGARSESCMKMPRFRSFDLGALSMYIRWIYNGLTRAISRNVPDLQGLAHLYRAPHGIQARYIAPRRGREGQQGNGSNTPHHYAIAQSQWIDFCWLHYFNRHPIFFREPGELRSWTQKCTQSQHAWCRFFHICQLVYSQGGVFAQAEKPDPRAKRHGRESKKDWVSDEVFVNVYLLAHYRMDVCWAAQPRKTWGTFSCLRPSVSGSRR